MNSGLGVTCFESPHLVADREVTWRTFCLLGDDGSVPNLEHTMISGAGP
jgi:hypothetical protein